MMAVAYLLSERAVSSHVLTEDVIQRKVEGKKLISKRLLTKTSIVPKWGEKYLNKTSSVKIIEESVVDLEARTITTYTRNIDMRHLMDVEEKCFYLPGEDNATTILKNTWVTSSIFGLGRPITSFVMERYKKQATKASQGLVEVLSKIYPSGPAQQSSSPVEQSIVTPIQQSPVIAAPQSPLSVSPTSLRQKLSHYVSKFLLS
ncbi:PRELID1 [Cordylochernes scorpioides]|uniref:PRELID1 n=1 Tax=Cordylochernes scorpioides TaxID=51811 RepID=A0ABY6KCD6_9ARAC|nr:PRELID1 [Cordylochernes scorpioides]